jgi:hypothetical protein
VITESVLRYLRTGLEPGLFVYDSADPALRTLRLVA